MNQEITICLTSAGRFDLLERTIKSLVEHWDGPKPKEFLIYEDSGQSYPKSTVDLIISIRHSFCSTIFVANDHLGGNKGPGQIKAIDQLYSMVSTTYIFHCEDDWEFYRKGFIQPSLDILENNPKICQVWIREPNDRNGHPAIGRPLQTESRAKHQMMKTGYRGVWNGFSFNPGLRRKSDYDLIAPYSNYMKRNSLETEAEIGKQYLKKGFRAATLLTGYCKHIGNGRHIN
jgi:hypothetical protein